MSSEENKKIVRRYQEIYNDNDLEALGEVLSKDLLTPKIMPGIPNGMEGAKAAHRIMLAGFPDYQTRIDDLLAEGDKVAARITMSGTHTGLFMGIPPTGSRSCLQEFILPELRFAKSRNIGAKRMGSVFYSSSAFLRSDAWFIEIAGLLSFVHHLRTSYPAT
jgi:predicted ester cyclase